VDCESLRSDIARAEQRSRERAEEARRRTDEARRRVEDQRRRVEEQRLRDRERAEERMREVRRSLEATRARAVAAQRRAWDDYRPRVSLGGGADIRRFDDVNRYLATAAVDFRSRSGLGLRPEVLFAWSDRQRELLPSVVCPACAPNIGLPDLGPVELRSRSKMLGVALSGTYGFLRGSPIRPYVLGGVGVLSTREVTPIVSTQQALPGTPGGAIVTYRLDTRDRVNLGLNAGGGLEFGRGPVRVFTEFRYFLNDVATPRGFSGMLPITAGLRL
jgi:hypothetical protein